MTTDIQNTLLRCFSVFLGGSSNVRNNKLMPVHCHVTYPSFGADSFVLDRGVLPDGPAPPQLEPDPGVSHR